MLKTDRFALLKDILNIILVSLTGCLGVVFSVLYIETFSEGFLSEFSTAIIAVAVSLITILTIITIAFLHKKDSIIYKMLLIVIIFITIAVLSMYLLKISGFLDKIDSVEDLRNYISSFGSFAVVLFIGIQFLQVVVLPIPSFITVAAGVLLFGPLKGAIYGCVGIISGSILAYYIGRVFGYKVAKWLVGEVNLNKALNVIKGKDNIVLTFMFLFPFFPDDVLCFVAGITTMRPSYFIIMIFVTRLITVFVSSYSLNNSIIPYNTWWGILLWILFFTFTVVMTIIIYKKGDKIEKFFSKNKKMSKKDKN